MRVVPDEENLHNQGRCFICESFLDRANDRGLKVIDTGRYFDPVYHTDLVGEKYLCSRCVEDAAHLLGFVTSDEAAEAKQALEEARRLMIPLQERVVSLTDEIAKTIHGAVDLPAFDIPDAVTDNAKEKV